MRLKWEIMRGTASRSGRGAQGAAHGRLWVKEGAEGSGHCGRERGAEGSGTGGDRGSDAETIAPRCRAEALRGTAPRGPRLRPWGDRPSVRGGVSGGGTVGRRGAGPAGGGAPGAGRGGGCIVPRAVHAGPASAPNMASRCHLCV